MLQQIAASDRGILMLPADCYERCGVLWSPNGTFVGSITGNSPYIGSRGTFGLFINLSRSTTRVGRDLMVTGALTLTDTAFLAALAASHPVSIGGIPSMTNIGGSIGLYSNVTTILGGASGGGVVSSITGNTPYLGGAGSQPLVLSPTGCPTRVGGYLTVGGTTTRRTCKFATLPADAIAGSRTFVSDATSRTCMSPVTGGGGPCAPVFKATPAGESVGVLRLTITVDHLYLVTDAADYRS